MRLVAKAQGRLTTLWIAHPGNGQYSNSCAIEKYPLVNLDITTCVDVVH